MFGSLFSLSLSLFLFRFWQSLCTQLALPSFCTPFYATLFTAFVVSLSLVSFYVFVNKLWQKNFSPSSEMRFWCCSSLGTPFHSLFPLFTIFLFFTPSLCLPLSLSVCFVSLFALCRWKTLSILSCLQLCDIQRIASDLPRPTPTYSSHCTSPLHSPLLSLFWKIETTFAITFRKQNKCARITQPALALVALCPPLTPSLCTFATLTVAWQRVKGKGALLCTIKQ